MAKAFSHLFAFAAGGAAVLYGPQIPALKPLFERISKTSSGCNCGANCKCGTTGKPSAGFRGTPENPCRAVCVLRPDSGSAVSGSISFVCDNERTAIHGELEGLTPGKHGFHVHHYGDLTQGCGSTKGHFNPFQKSHGGPHSAERHVGDLGNIVADGSGKAVFDIQDSQVKLCGPYSVIGRAIVVHADEDDLGKGGFPDSLTTGHAGARVACGVIGLAQGDPR